MSAMQFLIPIFFAALSTLVGAVLAWKFFPRLGLLDRPEQYGLSRAPIPYSVGIVVFFVFVLSTALFIELDKKVIGVIIAATVVALVGFLDDLFRLPALFRLGVQISVGAIVSLSGVKIHSITNPFGSPISLDLFPVHFFGEEILPLSALFIIVWIVLMMNVVNWLDGIPGLASGIGAIASVVMFILSVRGFHTVDQSTITLMSLSLAVSLFVFVFFDFSPPKLLMGDTGSMLIGFLLGVFAIFSGAKIATALIIMGFPILDAIWVIVRRLVTGRSPFRGDLLHLHHRLLRAGLSERKALFLNYTVCGLLGLIALLLDSAREKFVALAAVSVMMAITAALVVLFEEKRHGRNS